MAAECATQYQVPPWKLRTASQLHVAGRGEFSAATSVCVSALGAHAVLFFLDSNCPSAVRRAPTANSAEAQVALRGLSLCVCEGPGLISGEKRDKASDQWGPWVRRLYLSLFFLPLEELLVEPVRFRLPLGSP